MAESSAGEDDIGDDPLQIIMAQSHGNDAAIEGGNDERNENMEINERKWN